MKLVTLRRSVFQDVLDIFPKMRESDKEELWASGHILPFFALAQGLEKSELCMTALVRGVPVSMFGVVREEAGSGVIWMLGTDGLVQTKTEILEITKLVISTFLKSFPILHNYVHAKNEKSLRWLVRSGANIEPSTPYGVEGDLFHHFTFKEVSLV